MCRVQKKILFIMDVSLVSFVLKVVEVGDFEFWHTQEEAKNVIEQYQKIGFGCLYLTAKEVIESPEDSKKKIEDFLYVS